MTQNKKKIIAIDGPAGSGKSTTARVLAERLGYIYIDSGAMYRAVAWKALTGGVNLNDEKLVGAIASDIDINFRYSENQLHVFVGENDVTSLIRSEDISRGASIVSSYKSVRTALTAEQRRIGQEGGVVMEGRDIGTVVFPNADIKFFLTASSDARARRRFIDLKKKEPEIELGKVHSKINERDNADQTREHAPLMPAEHAIIIDTTNLSFDEVVESMLKSFVYHLQ